jgi:hypothetical protein
MAARNLKTQYGKDRGVPQFTGVLGLMGGCLVLSIMAFSKGLILLVKVLDRWCFGTMDSIAGKILLIPFKCSVMHNVLLLVLPVFSSMVTLYLKTRTLSHIT